MLQPNDCPAGPHSPPGLSLPRLCAAACLLGLLGAAAGLGVKAAVAEVRALGGVDSGWWVVVAPVAAGLVLATALRGGTSAPEESSGRPTSFLIVSAGAKRPTLGGYVAAGVVALLGGWPFGAEGPGVLTGAWLGHRLGRRGELNDPDRRTLLLCGAVAGLAAVFGTPVAAVLLVCEAQFLQFRTRALVPAAVAGMTAAWVRLLWLGPAPFLRSPGGEAMTPLVLPVSAAVGLLAAVLVAVLHEAGGVVDDVCSRVPVPRGWAPVFGGLGIGLLAAVLPFLAGDGTGLLTVLAGGGHTVPVGTLMVLLTGEVLALAVALGAGGTGGVLGPLLLIGASLGAVLSAVADQTFPGVVDPSACPTSAVTLGMAAMLAGGSRAPLAAVVFMLEITHQASLAPALLLACAVSHLAALQFVPGGLLGTGREPAGIAALPLDQVRRAMIVPPQTVSWSMPLGPLAEACARPDGQPGYPVLDDDQRLVGVVTPADLPEPDARPELGWLVAHDVMRCRPLEVATPNESLRDAAERMVRGNAALLPVVDPARPDRVIGVLTRDAVLQALTDVSPVPPRQPPNRTPPVNGPGRRAA